MDYGRFCEIASLMNFENFQSSTAIMETDWNVNDDFSDIEENGQK